LFPAGPGCAFQRANGLGNNFRADSITGYDRDAKLFVRHWRPNSGWQISRISDLRS
jgi:hypothetical protein